MKIYGAIVYLLLISINSEHNELMSKYFSSKDVTSNLRSSMSIPSDIAAIRSFQGT